MHLWRLELHGRIEDALKASLIVLGNYALPHLMAWLFPSLEVQGFEMKHFSQCWTGQRGTCN